MRGDYVYRRMEELFKDNIAISKAKNKDYSGTNDDFYHNFKYVERLGICSLETGILTRMSDKFTRLCNLVDDFSKAEVKTEKLEDTLKDLLNYGYYLLVYIKDKDLYDKQPSLPLDND